MLKRVSRAWTFARQEQSLRRQMEQEFREGWDGVLQMEGRKPPEFLTSAERSMVMGIVMKGAIFWGVIVEGLSLVAIVALAISDGHWADKWWALINGPLVAIGYFIYKRRVSLDRAVEMWKSIRQREIEFARRTEHKRN